MIPISKPNMDEKEKEAVLAVLNSGIIASGPKVKEFEADFAKYTGVKHAIAVSNGTCSLHTCMVMNGLGKGAKVITSPFTFIASGNSIILAGTFADGGSFSLYATKNITTAEGGMVTTNNDRAAEIARSFINHGSEKTY